MMETQLKDLHARLLSRFDTLLMSQGCDDNTRLVFNLADAAIANCRGLVHCLGRPIGPAMVDYCDVTYSQLSQLLVKLGESDRALFAQFRDDHGSTLEEVYSVVIALLERIRKHSKYPTFLATEELRRLYPPPWFTEVSIRGMLVSLFRDDGDDQTLQLKDLQNAIGCEDSNTVRDYLTAAGISVPQGRGKKRLYSRSELSTFLAQVINEPTRAAHSQHARKWLMNNPD